MGKSFIEYHSKKETIPYKADTLCYCLTQYVRNYISSNREVIANIDKNVRDAVLVDAINYIGRKGGIDFALYTEDLYNGKVDTENVNAQILLTTIQNHYSIYIFKYGMVESVLLNNHMNNCTEEFDANDGAKVLVDFINYIAEVNNYDRKFSIKDLYEKYKICEYKTELDSLKSFIKQTSEYINILAAGVSIDSIFADMSDKYNFSGISEDGTYYSVNTDENNLITKEEIDYWTKKEVEKELYAMTYAYGKMFGDKKAGQNEIINQKLLEMKRR